MDLSRDHFYKIIEEAETDIKRYSKDIILFVWFVWIKNFYSPISIFYSLGIVPDEYK